jgi:sialic acid synthase SpsE
VAGVMGAKVIEKHFTTDKTLPDSADHWLSVDPDELAQIVNALHWSEVLKGSSEKQVFDCEKETRKYDKRSWVTKEFIPKGTVLRRHMLTWKRPGTGIWPNEEIVGRTTTEDLFVDTIITWDHVK